MLASSEATQDMDEFRKLSCEYAEIGPVVALYQTWRQAEGELSSALEMLADPEMKELAEAEVTAVKGAPAADRGRSAETAAAQGCQGRSQRLS
jgi:peptide chain release factor 1